MVDPECLPGICMARLLAALEVCDEMSSSDARGSDPLVKKSLLVVSVSPQLKGVVDSDGKSKTGAGEHQPEMSEGGLLSSATVKRSDLQAECSSLPVENRFGNQDDTSSNF
jgi:hypothetical protein